MADISCQSKKDQKMQIMCVLCIENTNKYHQFDVQYE